MINLQNFYKDTLKTDVTFVGVGKIYLTLAKPTVTPGILVISPNSASLREIIKYTATGTDATGDYVEVTDAGHRGLGGTTAQSHKQLEPVRMNVTKEHFESIFVSPTFTGNVNVPTPTLGTDAVNKDFAEGLANAGASDASTTVKGIGRLSTAPGTTIGTATMTIASPAVITKAGHGLTVNDIVKFTTTGALPTGIVASTPYYVIATDLTTDTFKVATTQGGSAVNTSGSQSGTHTLVKITPTMISDTDPRLPTQAENDAMGGTSGTAPSVSNKFVDSADVSDAGIASKIIRATAGGLLPLGAMTSYLIGRNFLAGADLTANEAVFISQYAQADGGVKIDTTVTSTSGTFNITVGNNSNRIIVIDIGEASSVTGVTAGGNAMTNIQSYSPGAPYGNVKRYWIANPGTGTVSIVITGAFNVAVARSIYNASQSAPTQFATGAYSSATGAYSLTIPGSANACSLMLATSSNTNGNGGWSGGGISMTGFDSVAGQVVNNNLGGGGGYMMASGASEIKFAPSSTVAGFNHTVFSGYVPTASMIGCVIAPATAPTTGLMKSTAKTSINGTIEQAVHGYVVETETVGATDTKIYFHQGEIPGFSGLTPGAIYYLSDTRGAISTTAGTATKKQGVARSATSLVISTI